MISIKPELAQKTQMLPLKNKMTLEDYEKSGLKLLF